MPGRRGRVWRGRSGAPPTMPGSWPGPPPHRAERSRRARRARRGLGRTLPAASRSSVALEDAVDETVLARPLGAEEAVSLHVGAHLLGRLAGVLGVDLIDTAAQAEDLA